MRKKKKKKKGRGISLIGSQGYDDDDDDDDDFEEEEEEEIRKNEGKEGGIMSCHRHHCTLVSLLFLCFSVSLCFYVSLFLCASTAQSSRRKALPSIHPSSCAFPSMASLFLSRIHVRIAIIVVPLLSLSLSLSPPPPPPCLTFSKILLSSHRCCSCTVSFSDEGSVGQGPVGGDSSHGYGNISFHLSLSLSLSLSADWCLCVCV